MADNYFLSGDIHVPTTEDSLGNRVFNPQSSWYTEILKGNVPGHSIVHKFGAGTIGTTLVPVTQTTSYQTPTTAQALEFVSSSADDTSAGSGAREITIQGLDENWQEVTQTLTPNGTTPVALTTNLTRLYRWYVSSSGTYATETTGSHAGTLTIRDAGGGGSDWSTIPITPLAIGQSQIGVYTIQTGYTAYLLSKLIFVDGNKSADLYFFQRDNADDVSEPYTGTMRLVEREVGVIGGFTNKPIAPTGAFTGVCDVGLMAVVSSGTADISVEFELLLVQDGF